MRARSDAGIVLAAPVDQIVPALGARPRVVGDFVGRQAFAGADQLREVVQIAPEVIVGDRQLAGRAQAEERRARLDGQLIEREMLGRFRDGALELDGPGGQRLARPRINEIERIALEDRARDRNGRERLLRRVQTAQFLERAIVERLHAERDTIDAGAAIAAEARGLHAGRIGLQRHFDVAGDAPVLTDAIEDRLH
mgnify:CR=1 FL=1